MRVRVRRPRLLGASAAALLVLGVLALPASSSDVTGRSGTQTALPLTDSAVTVRGRGEFSSLEVTVNQTQNLVNQAVSVTWKGGEPTVEIGGPFGSDYLQLMQCWGDDDGTVPGNPGPPPEQCAFGAQNAMYGGVSGIPFPPGSFATERIISRRGWPGFDEEAGTLEPRTGNLWRDFVAVDGTRIGSHIDPAFNPSLEGGAYWQNPFFNLVTTNEVAGARTLPNGEGSEFFQVVTGVENSGLGCGQRVQQTSAGPRVPRCWLVIVPRSDPETENAGTPFGPTSGVVTSPLGAAQWANRIAIPLEFNPVDSACSFADDAARLVGSELLLGAMSSWQPALCGRPGKRPYAYGIVADAVARQQLLTNVVGSPGMYVVSRPLDAEVEDPASPTVYAPLTVSGLTIGFNIERRPDSQADEAAQRLRGVRVENLNLTPRLVAKLLTQSYQRQVSIKRAPDYGWLAGNADHLAEDEDFLRFNPEFRELAPIWRKELSGLTLPAGSSDGATQLWEYVLADPEARAWMGGEPDEWGMRVNPVYDISGDPASGSPPFAAEVPNTFPKADPYCYQAPDTPQGVRPPLLCGTDWNPYAQSLRDAARLARSGTDGARLQENSFATSSDRYYSRTPPQPVGARTNLALTDTASARLFGLQMASLSRPGDNRPGRSFVAPDTDGLLRGVEAMAPGSDPAVLEPDPSAAVAGAYPLTMLTYAALRPLDLTNGAREEFAALIEYAVGEGQVSGLRYGQLPGGYAPLPAALVSQARKAATTIRELQPSPEPASPGSPGDPTGGLDPGGWVDGPAGPGGTGFGSSGSGAGAGADDPSAPVPPTAPTADLDVVLARTPGVAVPPSRIALPILLGLALVACLGALEITKRPRPAAARREGI